MIVRRVRGLGGKLWRGGRPTDGALATLPLLLLVAMAWDQRWMSDDGFINLRVVSQVVAGNGPVFNSGERVEVATSPAWIAVLSGADAALPLRLEWIAVLLGIALTLTGLGLSIAAAAELWRRPADGVPLVPVGALCLAVLPPVWDYASSGLEGGLAWAWLGASFFALVRWSRSPVERVAPWTAVLVGIGPLIRPDYAIFTLVFVAAVSAGEVGRWRARVRPIWLAAVVPVTFQLFRMGYYGALTPNTYFAKEGGEPRWDQGWAYLGDFVGTYWVWIPVAALGLGGVVPLVAGLRQSGERRGALVAAALPVSGILACLAIVRFGGDFMHARLFLPPLLAVIAPAAVVPVRRAQVVVLAALVWALVCLVALRPPPLTAERLSRVHDNRAASLFYAQHPHPVTIEDWGYDPGGPRHIRLDPTHRLYEGSRPLELGGEPVPLAPGSPPVVVLAYGVGAVSYSLDTDAYVADLLGLGDVLTARLDLDARGRPGHEKALPPAWVWARYIDPDLAPDPSLIEAPAVIRADAPTLASVDDAELARDVAIARAVLGCQPLARLEDTATEPLTAGRVVDNAVAAVTLFPLRISPDPSAAQAELC